MQTLNIRTEANESTIDGVCYNFTRNKIDYTVFRMKGSIDVWKRNNQLGTVSSDSFVNGINHLCKPMARFLQQAMKVICADDGSNTQH
ncbi:MAG: hypothetical protein QM504_10300 [Pseudomonadota bacterium]